mmetsp:Transcript_22933/g.74282  ORF Transcript_22933/g.74282 Transcript_22933/m.74282 type:complete len:265 (+) Transcript_22933:828-1622(+)
MAATECSAACDQAAAPVSPPPPPQATTCSPDGRREAGKQALELAMGDGNRDGAVGGAVCADGAEGREAVAAAARDRGVDGTTRGVGGGQVVSVGEENLVRELETDPHYPDESILVHEFGHTVLNLGMSEEARLLVTSAHTDAYARKLYPTGCYMASNPDEYWAEGTQAWFDATARTDVNGHVSSRARLCAHDPALALLLRHAYGDTAWRFTDTLADVTKRRWRRMQGLETCRPRDSHSLATAVHGAGASAEVARCGRADAAAEE